VNIFAEELFSASPTATDRKLYPSVYSLWHHRGFGKLCAASADGRLAGEELSESQSPVYGTEVNGPTAMFNSVAKLPFKLTPSGGMNVKFQPKLFAGEAGHKTLMALLETYFSKGGMHAQINVVGKKTLMDAQEHPEKYKNLLVRIVGYSAYFVTLSPEQQHEIIDRTEL
jgi:formate C-acetyltransferase